MKLGLLKVFAFMAVLVAAILWLYVRFLAPRMNDTPVARVVLPIAFVFFVFLPFVGALRGNTLETRTESQIQWAHGSHYWVFLAVLVIAPFSLPAAGIVATLIVVGALTYSFLLRPKSQP